MCIVVVVGVHTLLTQAYRTSNSSCFEATLEEAGSVGKIDISLDSRLCTERITYNSIDRVDHSKFREYCSRIKNKRAKEVTKSIQVFLHICNIQKMILLMNIYCYI